MKLKKRIRRDGQLETNVFEQTMAALFVSGCYPFLLDKSILDGVVQHRGGYGLMVEMLKGWRVERLKG